jgi:hypothetical protein
MEESWIISADLMARSRFVVSPLSETVAAITVLSRPDPPGTPWVRSFRAQHREAYLGMLAQNRMRAVVAEHMWRPGTGLDRGLPRAAAAGGGRNVRRRVRPAHGLGR